MDGRPRCSTRLAGLLAALAALLPIAPPPAAAAPYRGVDTWYAFGPAIDEGVVLDLANELAGAGLRAAGYRLVWLDAGWWDGTRDETGAISPSPEQWPHGLAWLTARLHGQGLRAGIYLDLGRTGCGNGGSSGHLQADLDQVAAWGFDAVKADFCGASLERRRPRPEYAALARDIARLQPRRRLTVAVSVAAMPAARGYPALADSALDAWRWAPSFAASWRTGPDLGGPGDVRWSAVLRNAELDARHPSVGASAGDPDYLVPGLLSPGRARAQLALWAMLGAPLMVSADPATLPASVLAALTSPAVLALDAAPSRLTRLVSGGVEIWRRALPRGPVVYVLLNPGGLTRRVRGPAPGLHEIFGGRAVAAGRLTLAPGDVLALSS